MIRISTAFGPCLGRAIGVASDRSTIMNGDGRHRASPVEPVRARVPRLASLLLAAAALATTSTAASAAMEQGVCNPAAVVAKALPAIVNVTVVKVGTGEGENGSTTTTATSKSAKEHIQVFVGSGSIIDPSGVIVTNRHVIQGAAQIRVIFDDKTEVQAKLIAAGAITDLALLKVDMPKPLPTLEFADSDAVKIGQPVIAIGNPLGLGTSVSTGVVSALNRDLMRTPFDDFIQTDATINPGNSGGPLLDCQGEIIGVNTALLSNNKLLGSIGLGFALPSNDARFVADKLRNPEIDEANWIGLHLQDLTAQLATTFGLPNMEGALVTGVDPGSPAARASLVPGDIITGADGQKLWDARAVLRTVLVKPVGAPITLQVWRQDHATTVTAEGRPWPGMLALRSDVLASAASVARAQAEGLDLGLHLTAITDAERKRFGLTETSGVLIDQVSDGSQAQERGLKPGDVITQVGNRPATAPENVNNELLHPDTATGDLVALLVHGKGGTRWVAMFVGRLDVAQLVAPVDLPNSAGMAQDVSARPQGAATPQTKP
jgi:serine protease Do